MSIVLQDRSELVSSGKLFFFQIVMPDMRAGRSRNIRVWLPDCYDGVRRFPVLYMHDGQFVFPDADFPEAHGRWHCDLRISGLEDALQCIVVAIDTSDDRGSELLPPYRRNPAHKIPRKPGIPDFIPLGHCYADFIRSVLKPLIDERFLTLPDAAHTAVGGSSMGGLQSFYMTLRDPDVFGRSLDMSPGMGILDESCLALIDSYDRNRLKNVRFFLYSGDQGMDSTIMESTLRVYRRMKAALNLGPDQLRFVLDSRESHWATSWSKYLAEGIRFLFSEDNGTELPPAYTQHPPRDEDHAC